MSETVTSAAEIPEAAFYVVMRDRFLSGWGRAEEQDATYVAPCESRYEAEIVSANARARGDQDRVRIVENKPRPKPGWKLMLMTREDAPRWYQPAGFGGSEDE